MRDIALGAGMWVIVLVVVSALGGQRMQVVRYATYVSEESCKAAIVREVPGRLDMSTRSDYDEGFVRYVCVRLKDMEIVGNPK